MNIIKQYIIGAMALAATGLGLGSCQDHFDQPDLELVPVASKTANTTIAEFKEMMWNESNNYCDPVPTREDGEHIIVSGRVISSDFAGNCFKYIVLQDETGALNFSINSYNLYLNYRRGQQVVVDLTELYAGKYRGLEQVGFPSFNTSINGYETSFMAPELFSAHAELNGMPNLAEIDTITVSSFSELGTTPSELRKWQSQLVRFNNVEFVPSDLETLSTYHSSGETQQIRDAAGDVLDIRTSGYANFWNNKVPTESCDVVAILGYYVSLAGSGSWQLTLIDANSIMNVGHPTVPKGNEENPYTVAEAVAQQVNGDATTAWVQGYIVGVVAPEVETVSSSSDIEWEAPFTLGNTLVIGQTPESRELDECLVVALPQGTALREYGSLREHPENLGKIIDIRGTFAEFMGTYGLTGNNGSSSEFKIEGVDSGNGETQEGDGTEENPYTCEQIIAMNPSSTTDAVETGIWAKGYIVGYYQDYAGHFEGGGTQAANILLADSPDVDNTAKTICVQLVFGTDARTALNLMDNPGNIGKVAQVFGDVMKYNTLPGIKNTTSYKLDGEGSSVEPTPSGNTVTLLSASDANGVANWTLENTTLPSGLTNVWRWVEYNSAYYLNGSGYSNGAAAAEGWAISPVIDLSSATTVSVAFEHAAKFQTTLQELCGFYVREATSTVWVKLDIPTWPAAGAWTFANSGNISLASYAGKKVQLGFKYGSTTAGADTWEIKNLVITSDGTVTVEGAGSSTPVDPTPDDPTPVDPTPGGQPGDGTFNFADPTTLTGNFDLNNQTADNSNMKVDVADVTFYSGEAALVNSGSGTAARLYYQTASSAWSYRFYRNTKTTISVAEGYHLVSVSFEPQTTAHGTALAGCGFSSGTYDSTTKVWTAADATTTSLVIDDATAGTVGLTKVTVVYAK